MLLPGWTPAIGRWGPVLMLGLLPPYLHSAGHGQLPGMSVRQQRPSRCPRSACPVIGSWGLPDAREALSIWNVGDTVICSMWNVGRREQKAKIRGVKKAWKNICTKELISRWEADKCYWVEFSPPEFSLLCVSLCFRDLKICREQRWQRRVTKNFHWVTIYLGMSQGVFLVVIWVVC